MNKITAIITIIMICSVSVPSHAIVLGGSNLSFVGYPEHACYKPYKPYQFHDEYEIDSYRYEVETYINCINEYVENSNNDIQRIQEAAQSALDEANSF